MDLVRCVLRFLLNESTEGEVLSSDGSEFHQVGPMEQNARSPYVTDITTEFLFINLESQLRLVAEVTGNSLSALLDSHPYHVHTHICLCLRTLGVYIMIVNLTFSHCFNVF